LRRCAKVSSGRFYARRIGARRSPFHGTPLRTCPKILRGAIQAVPGGEIEAARAIGMRPRQVYARIIWPRAFRMALPAYGNEIILMLKASALASTSTLLDLTGMAKTISAKNYMPVETFITAGAFYLIITYALTHLIRFLEKHLHPDRTEPVVIFGCTI